MKLKKPFFGTGAIQPESESDLISSVYHLVDCIARALPNGNTPEAHHYREAGQTAFASALAAEQRIATLMERVVLLEKDTITDELTGLLNRRGITAEMNRAIAAARRYSETGMLIYVDLDGFKAVNDAHSHAAGDAVLRRVAWILKENVRDTDSIARIGGDEFVVLLTHTTRKRALGRADILDQILNTAHVTWKSRKIPLAASIGIQAYDGNSKIKKLLCAADEAMYKTKKIRNELLKDQKFA